MKKIILPVFVTMVLASCNNGEFKKSITDNGETMTIKVLVNSENQKIDYEHTFDVRNMSSLQKKKLQNHIFDSLGVANKK